MKMNSDFIQLFFDNFPFAKGKEANQIDKNFINNAYNIILSSKVKIASNPPNLNIFEGFSVGDSELKHCSILSWFLDPIANHGQGELFFDLFLNFYGLEKITNLTKGGYFRVITEDYYSEDGRIDISISSKSILFIIEAKISADEQNDQIERYNKIIKTKSKSLNIPSENCKLFFLTKNGDKPKTGKADFCISWLEISEIMKTFALKCHNNYVSSTASQYAKYIKMNLMEVV